MKTLRQRIIDEMPSILKSLASEKRPRGLYRDDDFRPAVVRSIKRIAELDEMPKFEAVRVFERVVKNVKRLEASLKELPPLARDLVKFEVDGLDDAEREIENMRETGRTEAKRRMLVAALAFDLISDHGSTGVSLSADKTYVELANLLLFVATGKHGDMRKSCAQHFDDLEEESGVVLRSRRRGPRSYGDPPAWALDPDYQERAKKEHQVEQRRRKAAIAKWPPLEQVVDEVLNS